MPTTTPGWRALLAQWGRELQLWGFIVLTLQLFRLLLIAIFADQLGERATLTDIAAVVAVGLRFDISTAALWVLPTFLASISVAWLATTSIVEQLRTLSLRIYVIVALLVFGADIVYVDEYGDQFNQTIFGLVHDDTRAILITIWKEYHPLVLLSSVALFSLLLLHAARYWFAMGCPVCEHLRSLKGVTTRTLAILVMVLLLIAMGRGGTLWGEPIRLKHAFVADDLFLNRTVVNPFTALRLAVETHQRLQKGAGLEMLWPSGDLQAAAALFSPTTVAADIDLVFTRTARGSEQGPKHIFILLMESQSGWPVLPRYRSMGFSPELSRLADQGVYFPNFLPSSSGTIGSMNAILTGLPDSGVHINYETESLRPYPSGIAALFNRLGYQTRFFYGGFLSWQRLDSFAIAQGFDELYGGGSMSRGANTNEWGVDDRVLFDFILDTIAKEPDRPSLNFILTTSNHPPYDLDLEALGFPFTQLPEPLEETKDETLKVLGHLWYADQQAGRFVDEAASRYPDALFALTGDHTARLQIRFPGDNVFEQFAVPLILYSPELFPQATTLTTPGSHVDLPATLVELSAPTGFEYVSFGQDLRYPAADKVGYGFNLLQGEEWIATTGEKPQVYRLEEKSSPQTDADPTARIAEHRQRYQALQALAWQRVKRGSLLPANPK